MRVRMKSIYAGPAGNYQPGETADLPSKEANALVAGGYAVEVEVKQERRAPSPRTATVAASETTQGPGGQTATAPATQTAGQ